MHAYQHTREHLRQTQADPSCCCPSSSSSCTLSRCPSTCSCTAAPRGVLQLLLPPAEPLPRLNALDTQEPCRGATRSSSPPALPALAAADIEDASRDASAEAGIDRCRSIAVNDPGRPARSPAAPPAAAALLRSPTPSAAAAAAAAASCRASCCLYRSASAGRRTAGTSAHLADRGASRRPLALLGGASGSSRRRGARCCSATCTTSTGLGWPFTTKRPTWCTSTA
ncbi:hypothetical protein COO60DRAFT_1504859 [Scenedesmus sp. NREL 46B-D3]|nr:hypothetical protein COO60DRAFT_1504859 [Scenedesmus sp. NREL 46B-D3]